MIKVVQYINQFFAQIGGEEMAYVKPEVREGIVGPGAAFNAGRYGVACGTISTAVKEELGIPSLTGMYVENKNIKKHKKT